MGAFVSNKFWGINQFQVLFDEVDTFMTIDHAGKISCVPCSVCESKSTYCKKVMRKCERCDYPKFIWGGDCHDKCPDGYYWIMKKGG